MCTVQQEWFFLFFNFPNYQNRTQVSKMYCWVSVMLHAHPQTSFQPPLACTLLYHYPPKIWRPDTDPLEPFRYLGCAGQRPETVSRKCQLCTHIITLLTSSTLGRLNCLHVKEKWRVFRIPWFCYRCIFQKGTCILFCFLRILLVFHINTQPRYLFWSIYFINFNRPIVIVLCMCL